MVSISFLGKLNCISNFFATQRAKHHCHDSNGKKHVDGTNNRKKEVICPVGSSVLCCNVHP